MRTMDNKEFIVVPGLESDGNYQESEIEGC